MKETWKSLSKGMKPLPYTALFFAIAFLFLAALLASQVWEYRYDIVLIRQREEREADEIAERIRVSMVQLAEEATIGGKILDKYVDSLNRVSGIRVRIIHSESIDAQYGPEPEENEQAQSREELNALADGKPRRWTADEQFIRLLPLKAEAQCVHCHHQPGMAATSVPTGHVLGLVEVKTPVAPTPEERRGLLEHTILAVGLTLAVVIMLLYSLYRLTGQLRMAEEKFRSAFDAAATGMAMVDLEGKFLRVNAAFCAMLGYAPKELLGMAVEDISYAADWEVNRGLIRRLLAGEIPSFTLEKRYLRKDGSIVWGLVGVTFLRDSGGNPEYLIAQVQDITNRKRAEEELLKAKDMAEEATKLKDKFVSLVSHDLKGPLATMLGFLKMVREDETSPPNEGAKLILDSALRSGEQMHYIIGELLDVSRLKMGGIKPRLRFIPAREMADRAIQALEFLASKKGIRLENAVPENALLHADPALFSQVLQNFVSNAVKFSNRGGTVRVYMPEGRPATVAVADTGMGIQQGNRADLFRYDKKTSTTGTSGERGTGLGLPMAHDIMAAHNGTIAVESEPGRGSVFYATLPAKKPLALTSPDTDAGIAKALTEFGIELVPVSAPVGAPVASTVPDLMIVTVKNAQSFIAEARQNTQLKNVPVILDATKEPLSHSAALRLDVDGLISATDEKDALLKTVAALLRGKPE